MATKTEHTTDRDNREVVLKRTFDAPRELVWKAWTDPDHLTKWWGPKGFETPREKIDIDLHAGGRFHFGMVVTSDELATEMGIEAGTEIPDRSEIVEISKPERLVLKHEPQPDFGNPEPAITRVEFHKEGDKTRITLTSGPYNEEMATYAELGLNEMLDKLDTLLQS